MAEWSKDHVTAIGSVNSKLWFSWSGFSPAGCTSIRIAATLGYDYPLVCGSHHVDNSMAWFMA
jgi:hypothetical protein